MLITVGRDDVHNINEEQRRSYLFLITLMGMSEGKVSQFKIITKAN
jgi:hypothetical protein